MKSDKKRVMAANSLKNLKPVKKGEIRNPKGKAAGTLDEVTKFKNAIALFEKEQNKDFYNILLDKANKNPQIYIAIFKALIPQQTEENVKVEHISRPYKDLSDEELIAKANEIFKRTRTSNNREDTARA